MRVGRCVYSGDERNHLCLSRLARCENGDAKRSADHINPDGNSCNFALAVADNIAEKGLGGKLMISLMGAAREQGLKEIEGSVLNNNHRMLNLMRDLGFALKTDEDDHRLMRVSKSL